MLAVFFMLTFWGTSNCTYKVHNWMYKYTNDAQDGQTLCFTQKI